MIFKQRISAEIEDWITPAHVEVVKVGPHSAQLERIQQRVNELREAMGPRYLCHEKNRVRRLDGRSYRPRSVTGAAVRAVKRAA
ncbi:MAG: hypothetical protein ABJA83_07125 [Burkholderiaceae bacterium]